MLSSGEVEDKCISSVFFVSALESLTTFFIVSHSQNKEVCNVRLIMATDTLF